MLSFFRGRTPALVVAFVVCASSLCAQQAPEGFHWVNFHSQKDQSFVVWVTQALRPEKWTAIREIGVQYDAALVVTTLRNSPQAAPDSDSFTVWNVSLTTHKVTPLLKAANLRWEEWLHYLPNYSEPAILYDNCYECPADTYLTSFYYDGGSHSWTARWMHEGQGIHLWSASPPPGVNWTQVYAVMVNGNGSEYVGTWSHFDYGARQPPADYVYEYSLDPGNDKEQVQQLSGVAAQQMELLLCGGQNAVRGLARGQDSPFCRELLHSQSRPASAPARSGGHPAAPGAEQ